MLKFREENTFTLDLFQNQKDKTLEYQMWVRRIMMVSSTSQIPYDSLWQMTETEFRIVEELSREILNKKKENRDSLIGNS